jgi:toll-like receptor 13
MPPKIKDIFLKHRVQTFHKMSPKRICVLKNVIEEITCINAEIHMDINTISGLDMLRKLRLVDIANKQMQFHFNDSSYPKHLKNLEKLTIEGNHISLGDNFTFSKISTKLTAIQLLNINMKEIPKNVFQMLKLLKSINISSNVLQSLNINFSNLVSLESLDISNNPIKYLEIDSISSLIRGVRNSTLKLYIHNSELICTCLSESLQTIEFLKTAHKYGIEVDNLEELSCIYNYLRQPLLTVNVEKLKNECFPSNFNVILGSTLSNLTCIIVGAFIFIAYRYRYRLYISFLRVKWKQQLWNLSENRQYSYDAFLSYCALDRFWVHNVLVKELEEKYGFKLCIHYRDFGFGDIADVIIQNITDSRYTIIILSEQSLDSPWCQFELKVAHGNSVRIGNELIIIKLGEISRSDVNVPLVKELLDSRVYLQWPESAVIGDDSKDVRYQEMCALF